ncbi:MAG: LysR family transcriptional regulator [Lautropia sp.]
MTTRIRMAQLRHFLLVSEHGSYRKTAARVFRSQSAVSRSIQSLEAGLGGGLFQVDDRAEPTPLGRACLPIVRDLVEHFDRAVDCMVRLAAAEHGSLSIGGTSTAATRFLPAVIAAFRRELPLVELRVVDDNSVKLRKMVRLGELDLAVCSPEPDDARLSYRSLACDAFGFVCQSTHPLASRPVLTWDDIRGEPLIRTVVHDQLIGTVGDELLARMTLSVSNMISLWALLRAGVGVTVLPVLSAPDPGSGLVYIPLEAPVLHRNMGLIRLVDGNDTPPLRLFESIVAAHFDALATPGVCIGERPSSAT